MNSPFIIIIYLLTIVSHHQWTLAKTLRTSTLTRSPSSNLYSIIIFEPPDHLKEFITAQGVERKITIGDIKINITGDLSFDLEQFCGELSRFNNIIAFLDIPLAMSTEPNGAEDKAKDSLKVPMDCYRRQLLANLSRRVNAPLIIFGHISDCPGAIISSMSNIESPSPDSLTFQFLPAKFLFGKMLENLIQPSEDKWNGFGIIYDNFQEFDKYSNALQTLTRSMYIRHWSRINSIDKENLQKVLHLKTYFLDLQLESLKNFVNTIKEANLLTPDRDFFVFVKDDPGDLYWTFGAEKLYFLKWHVPDISNDCKSKSVMEQYICSFYDHIHLALTEIGSPNPRESKCLSDSPNPYAYSVFKSFKTKLNSTYGFIVDKDKEKMSLNYTVDMSQLKNSRLEKLESWEYFKGFNRQVETVVTNIDKRVAFNKVFRVVTIIEKPFVVRNFEKDGIKLYGNDQFEGFAIDLLKELASIHKFKYEIYAVETYGTMQQNGTWNGIIGELIEHRATLAVASLTITYDRERVIDFTTPFMSLSLTVIIQKAKTKVEFLQFMEPLSRNVWLSMLGAYLIVSLILFFVGRSTPKEWYARHPCSTQIENQFTILNSFWFTVGSLMQQGCEISPRATSTRIIGTIWWFFILIMVSSYTANLAAFLTIERLQSEIENVEELSRQDKIRYGTIAGGSTYAFFNTSEIDLYKRMWHTMKQNKSNFVNSTQEGIRRVLEGGYAYILESTMSDFHVQRQCDLVTLGGNFDPRSYAIGLPIGNTGLRDLLSETILQLQKKQVLENLRQKWFMVHNSAVPCDKQASSSPIKRNQLTMKTMSGAFFGLGSGLIMAILVWFGEIIFWLWRINSKKKDNIVKIIKQQVRQAIFNCNTIAESSSLNMYSPDMDALDSNNANMPFEKCYEAKSEREFHCDSQDNLFMDYKKGSLSMVKDLSKAEVQGKRSKRQKDWKYLTGKTDTEFNSALYDSSDVESFAFKNLKKSKINPYKSDIMEDRSIRGHHLSNIPLSSDQEYNEETLQFIHSGKVTAL